MAYPNVDDEWKPNHLSCLLNYLLENPEVDLVYGDSEWVQKGVKSISIPYSVDYAIATLRYWNCTFATDILHCTDAACEIGEFNKSLQACEYWDWWLSMTRFYTIRHLPITLGVRYWQKQCVSTGDYWQDNVQVYEANENRLKEIGEAALHGLF